MSTAELKTIKHSLVNWISQLSDTELINFLNGIRIARTKKNDWEELTDFQKKQVLAGIKDAEKGNLISSDLFWDNLLNA